MRGTQNVYCNYEFFDAIIKGRKTDISYSIAYNMLNRLSNIIVAISPNNLRKLIEEDEIYKKLNKRENMSFVARDWISEFTPSDICDDVFLINETDIKEYKHIREEYGCLIIANTPNELKAFERYTRGHNFNLVPKSERVDDSTIKCHDSWEQFFEEFRMAPLNAIVITDNYMFGSKFERRKKRSLFAILKSIAPKKLKEDFQITLFFNNSPDKNGALPLKKEDAETLINDIKALKLCKSVKVSIVAHSEKTTTHDRELISNYYYMKPGVGFSVIDENGIQEIATGPVQHIFCDMNSNVSVKQLQAEVSLWLKPIFEKKKGGTATFSYIVGDRENRLLV